MSEPISAMSKQLLNAIGAKAKAFFKTMWQDFAHFAKTKWLYFVSSLIYFILTCYIWGLPAGLLLSAGFYLISLLVVFSPLGEILSRVLEHVRKIETKREMEYLLPLFQEVYLQAKEQNPELGRIDICVIDRMVVNACALGKHTIAVTKGAIETFDADELKALIAHEIAHILNGDTLAKLYALIGGGFFTVFVVVSRVFIFIAEWIEMILSKSKFSFAWIIITLTKLLFDLIVFAISFIMQIVISIYSRGSEYRADRYAYELGHGEKLIEALYLMEKMKLGDNSTVIQKMTANHPRITARIKRLEILLDQESAMQTAP